MHTIPLFIALVIVIIGALVRPSPVEEPTSAPSALGETSVSTPSPTATPPAGGPPTATPTRTQSTDTSGLSLDTFRYSSATTKSSDENSLILESSDDPGVITDWYKEKIKAAGMNTKSFVVTKTNGNVKNVLVGAEAKGEIRVEITQKAGESTVQIVVTIQTS